jgi:hypothetical protein
MMAKQSAVRVGILIVMLLMACGCESKPQMYPVSGTVTFNGQPIAEGNIRFVPKDGSILEEVGEIRAGKFSFQSRPGPKRVEIFATREIPPPQPGMFGAREDYIPRRYNAQSDLSATVVPDRPNNFSFPLVSE